MMSDLHFTPQRCEMGEVLSLLLMTPRAKQQPPFPPIPSPPPSPPLLSSTLLSSPLRSMLSCHVMSCHVVSCYVMLVMLFLTASGPTQCQQCLGDVCTRKPQFCATDRRSLGATHCGTAKIKYLDLFRFPFDGVMRGCINCVGKYTFTRKLASCLDIFCAIQKIL